MPKTSPRAKGAIATILRRFAAENMLQTAAALAFTTLLALVPLLTLIVSVADLIPYFDALVSRLDTLLLKQLLPQSSASVITAYIGRFTDKARSLTVPGIAMLVLTSFLLLHTIERAFNHLWLVQPRPFLQRVRLYALAMTIWPVLMGAVAAVASFIVTASLGFIDEPGWVRQAVLKGLSVTLLGLFFAFIYYTLPNAKVSKKAAITGGIFVTAMFALMQKGFELYLGGIGSFKSIYGAFAAVPIFLIWLHLCWAAVLAGGLIAATVFPQTRR